jgi:hypothetical protein
MSRFTQPHTHPCQISPGAVYSGRSVGAAPRECAAWSAAAAQDTDAACGGGGDPSPPPPRPLTWTQIAPYHNTFMIRCVFPPKVPQTSPSSCAVYRLQDMHLTFSNARCAQEELL